MSPRHRLLLAVAAVSATAALAAPRPASADCYDDECRARQWSRPRFEGGFGLLAGGFTVSSVHGGAVGLHVDGGARLGRLAVLGEYNFLSIGQDQYTYENPIRGVLHRLGANARYSLAAFGGHDVPIRGDIWVEGGLGTELVQWHGGGELSRRDLSFGVGGQMTVRVGGGKRPNFIGFYYAFRGLVARDPFPGKEMPTCAGPCDTPTGPSAWDTGAFFNFGVSFSR